MVSREAAVSRAGRLIMGLALKVKLPALVWAEVVEFQPGPWGVIEVSSNGTRYISFREGRKIALLLAAGFLLRMIIVGWRRRRR
jgi:hypothetical protein